MLNVNLKNSLNSVKTGAHTIDYQFSKRKVALRYASLDYNDMTYIGRVGYVGTGFHGSQKLADFESMFVKFIAEGLIVSALEPVLEKALYNSKFIAESNFGYLEKIGWSRSSRTDKGVHSLCSVFGVKLENRWKRLTAGDITVYDTSEQCDELPEIINEYLPETMRVFSAHPVKKGWDARKFCLSREYEYVLPFHLVEGSLFETDPEAMSRTMESYLGTHCWHNYTPMTQDSYNEDRRYIYDRNSSSTYYRKIERFQFREIIIDGKKYISFTIRGQSFLMHQIRKIVASVILYSKGLVDDDFVLASVDGPWKIPIPKAPSEGLFLKTARFRELDLNEPFHREPIDQFRNDRLIPHIASLWDEIDINSFHRMEEYFSSYKLENTVPLAQLKSWKQWRESRYEYNQEKEELLNAESNEL